MILQHLSVSFAYIYKSTYVSNKHPLYICIVRRYAIRNIAHLSKCICLKTLLVFLYLRWSDKSSIRTAAVMTEMEIYCKNDVSFFFICTGCSANYYQVERIILLTLWFVLLVMWQHCRHCLIYLLIELLYKYSISDRFYSLVYFVVLLYE